MKITFYLLLAFVAMALAVPAKNEDRSKSGNPPTKTEEKADESSSDSEENEETESTPSSSEEESSTEDNTAYTQSPEQIKCNKLIGQFVNGTFEGLVVKHDLEKILEQYGGPPGKVNATWTEKEDAPVEKEDLEKRPLPDADSKYWLYRYGASDAKTYIRIEHAVRRFSGTPKAFLEIRGTMYFTPDDLGKCGKSRKAEYIVDDLGFRFNVSHEYCWIGDTVSCANPAHCVSDEHGNITSCVAAPSHALLATLIGGGK